MATKANRIAECMQVAFKLPTYLDLINYGLQVFIFTLLLTIVLVKYRRLIGSANLCLLISWTLELFLWLGHAIARFLDFKITILVARGFYAEPVEFNFFDVSLVFLKIYSAVNVLLFIMSLLRLNKMNIIMEARNDSEEKLAK
jgi:hypothetical protein